MWFVLRFFQPHVQLEHVWFSSHDTVGNRHLAACASLFRHEIQALFGTDRTVASSDEGRAASTRQGAEGTGRGCRKPTRQDRFPHGERLWAQDGPAVSIDLICKLYGEDHSLDIVVYGFILDTSLASMGGKRVGSYGQRKTLKRPWKLPPKTVSAELDPVPVSSYARCK